MIKPSTEVQTKLSTIRTLLKDANLSGLRIRGSDWFSWATAGASNVVLLTSETGVAEILVTQSGAWVLTNTIEAERLKNEELSREFEVWEGPWAESAPLESFVKDQTKNGRIASDRPTGNELILPEELLAAKRRLLPEEINRYRALGLEASQAMTDTLLSARPDWTEYDLAAAGAQNLWKKGIHPALTLVGGAERVAVYRHPVASQSRLGRRAMLVFCARKYGLYANLTRFVYFETPTEAERKLHEKVAKIEAQALASTRVGARLDDIYRQVKSAYERNEVPEQIFKHHQGGTTGYLAREIVAATDTRTLVEDQTAVAWNPSLPGAKVEDTFVLLRNQVENLTYDPRWPSFECEGRKRPDLLVNP